MVKFEKPSSDGGGSSYIDSRFTFGVQDGLPIGEDYSANEKICKVSNPLTII